MQTKLCSSTKETLRFISSVPFVKVKIDILKGSITYYPFTAAIPGKTFPSKYSSIAPPPVLT